MLNKKENTSDLKQNPGYLIGKEEMQKFLEFMERVKPAVVKKSS